MEKLMILLLLVSGLFCFGNEEMVFKLGVLSNDNKMVEFKQKQNVNPGDKFKFIFEATDKAHVYFFVFSKDNKLALMFPKQAKAFDHSDYWNKLTFVPLPGKWLTIPSEEKGTMEVFIIASPKGVKKLDAYLKPSLTQEKLADLYEELLSLQRQYTLPPVFHEKAVSLYGAFKDAGKQNNKHLEIREIRCSGLYMEWYELDY